MTRIRNRSLRGQLAMVGFVGVLVPIGVMLAVVLATTEDVETEDVETAPVQGAPEQIESTGGVSMWVPITAALLTLPAGVGVWRWSGRAVQPLREMAAVADEIQEGSLDRRIALTRAPKEVQILAESFDRMLDRLDTSSATQQQLIEDVAHELRTPLAALANNTEVMLAMTDPTIDDYRASAERTTTQIERLQRTIHALLVNARGAHERTRQVDNDLMAIVRRVVEQQQVATSGIDFVVRGPDQLLLGIDGTAVERAVANLVENAAGHSPDSGLVVVEITQEGSDIRLAVTDQGPGVAPTDMDRIFDRYYQGDATSGEGHGIGLAIVRQVADAYGGITVESPLGPDGGTRFTMTFRGLRG